MLNLFSLLLQSRFSTLLSPSSLESSQLQIQRTKLYTAAQRRRSLSKTGYSRATSPFLQISCHVGMCKQTHISSFSTATCWIWLLQISWDFLRSSNTLSSCSQFLQWFIAQKFETIWLTNMKNTQFMFCSSSPFLFSMETPRMAPISVPADSESAPLHHPAHQWLTRPVHSHLPHPSKGAELLNHQQRFLHPFYSCLYADQHFSSLFLKSFSARGNLLTFPTHVTTLQN